MWPTQVPAATTDEPKRIEDAIRSLRHWQHAVFQPDFQSKLKKFEGPLVSLEIKENGSLGLPQFHESVMAVCQLEIQHLDWSGLKLGFAQDCQGLVRMLRFIATCTDDDTVKWDASVLGVAFQHRMRWPWRVNLHTIIVTYVCHFCLPEVERSLSSGPRAIAFIDWLLRELCPSSYAKQMRKGSHGAPLSIWILGARDSEEGAVARQGFFNDAIGLRRWSSSLQHSPDPADRINIYLVGDVVPHGLTQGRHVHVYTCSSLLLDPPAERPDLVVGLHSNLSDRSPAIVEEWIRTLQSLLPGLEHPPVIMLTSRCLSSAQKEGAFLETLGARLLLDPVRNLFSGAASHPSAHFDDNGWVVVAQVSSMNAAKLRRLDANVLCETAVQEASEDLSGRSTEQYLLGNQSSPALWGIMDLKYDSGAKFGERVKILEIGDGRSSRFSGFGARVKAAFQRNHKLDELENHLHHYILFENKKLTHDFMLDYGYGHILPKQFVYARVYTADLAELITSGLWLQPNDICVLKLCNRSRGAGCIPVRATELDGLLKCLLEPPANMERWLKLVSAKFIHSVSPGCLDEQLRHWWSNECPYFIVEQFCKSTPQHRKGREFDGTMRVGFVLHRRMERDHSTQIQEVQVERAYASQSQEDQVERDGVTQDQEGQAHLHGEGEHSEKLKSSLIKALWSQQKKGYAALDIQWLGGYWKLPEEDIGSPDLRGRVISKAQQGTALVCNSILHEVYAAISDAMQCIFSAEGHDVSPHGLSKRYATAPGFGAYAIARLAFSTTSMPDKRNNALQFAQIVNSKSGGAVSQAYVNSYINRIFGVFEALAGQWAKAEVYFEKSLEFMPTNATSYYLQGMCLLEMKRWKAAAQAMSFSLQLDPDFKAPYINLAVAWLHAGVFDNALEVSKVGLGRHPHAPHCFYNKGIALYMLACEAESAYGASTATSLRKEASEALETARDHIKLNRREGVSRGARPIDTSVAAETTEPASPKKKMKSLWTDADDDLLDALNMLGTRLPRPKTVAGWKFYGWRP